MKNFNPDDPIVLNALMTIQQPDIYSLDRIPEEEKEEEIKKSLPSNMQMIKSLSSSLKNVSKALIKGEKVRLSKGEAEERMKICASCEEYIKEENRCNLCGCYMRVKTRIATEKCPIGKW
jgi:hypothetical protein